MKTQIVNVTPRMAREWLKNCNTMNRPIRPAHVETLRISFERGEYVTTHQGLAFSDDDVLIDGQHRLTAISLLPDDASFAMLVTRGLDRDTVFPVTDAVQAKRNTSDALGIDGGLGYVGNFLARVYQGHASGLTPTFVEPFAAWVAAEYADLVGFCAGTSKTWSSAPVRSAAIIAMKTGCDADYVKLVYGALVRADFNAMPPLIQSLYRSHQSGKVRASAAGDIFVRCIKSFNPKNAKLTKVQVKDPSIALASVRDMMASQVFIPMKKAPVSAGARKSVSAGNYAIDGL